MAIERVPSEFGQSIFVQGDPMIRFFNNDADSIDVKSDAFRMSLYEDSGLDYPEIQHNLGWSTRKKHLDFLYNFIRKAKPEVVFETGTFEGHGTYAIAAACHANGNGARIFTFDYDGDPIQDESGNVTDEEWTRLRLIRANNLELIKQKFPDCTVQFTDGDTRKVLNGVVSEVGGWDFWYQDSMHYAEGIQQEWEIMENYANDGSIVIFDDVSRRNGFSKWFKKNHRKSWKYKPCRDFEHKQCLAQKI